MYHIKDAETKTCYYCMRIGWSSMKTRSRREVKAQGIAHVIACLVFPPRTIKLCERMIEDTVVLDTI